MPHSLCLSAESRVIAYDRSRPQPISPPWVEVTPEQFAAAQAMAYPRWTGTGVVNDPPPPPTLAEVKTTAIEANRAECRRRIVERWPEDQQRNAALGILSTEQTDACAAWIKACRAAENAASDPIYDANDAAGVAAVKVVWP